MAAFRPINMTVTGGGDPERVPGKMVVGVMPAHFELFQPADVYVPFAPWAATLPEDRGWHPGIFPVARLKDGVSIDDARVEMDAISQQLEAEFPESNKNVRALVTRVQTRSCRTCGRRSSC
jgi:hypothetical protein